MCKKAGEREEEIMASFPARNCCVHACMDFLMSFHEYMRDFCMMI